jgi:hypothetical protein
MIFGSTTQQVVRLATCPVLTDRETASGLRDAVSPPLEESSLVPIPQEIDDHARLALIGFSDGQTNAAGQSNVLARVQRHLRSGQQIPLDRRPAHEWSGRQELEHRRPHPRRRELWLVLRAVWGKRGPSGLSGYHHVSTSISAVRILAAGVVAAMVAAVFVWIS